MEENTKSIELPWTGERYIPEVEGDIELEHIHRYLMARELVKDRDVLDIASGEGYGSAMLAEVARSVVGVDISQDVVAHAERKYRKNNNLQFRIGSCEEIPLPSACVDVAVSFETIEHHDQHEAMMAEIKRVLRPDGLLIMSSPDKYEYSVAPGYSNPYHVKELYRHEFEQLLCAYFKNAVFYGQRIVYGSAILADKESSDILSYTRQDDRVIATSGILKPVYIIAAASDVAIPKVLSGIFEQPVNKSEFALALAQTLSRTVTERDAALAERNNAMAEYDKAIAERDAALAERKTAMAEHDKAIAERDAELSREKIVLDSLRQHASQLEEKLLMFQNSRSMRITRPLRELVNFSLRLRTRIRSKPEQYIPVEPTVSQYHTRILSEVPDQVVGLEDVVFEEQSEPVVSIVIPVFNKWRCTYACLRSIQNHTINKKTPYEVILADDKSTDDTPKMLQYVHGIQVITNPANLGFLRNCNKAAHMARGKFLCFFNNDTEVNEGWLDALVSVFENFDKVGVVGGKLIYPDGRIQEAGGIIKRDGWGVPYGRYDEQACYEYNYVKEVDCITGACLMVRKELFDMLGGFDDRYYPAFYGEFDLEFGIRNLGYKVMYQPGSVILHHESSTYGDEIKNHQSSLNHAKFREKWKNQLESQLSDNDFFLARDRSQGKKIILIVDDKVPEYDKAAGALSTYQYTRLFLDLGFKIIYLPDDRHPSQPYTGELQQLGIEVIYGEFDFARWIQTFGGYLHYAWLARPDIAIKYIDLIQNHSNARIFYYTQDLHYLRLERQHALEGTQWLKGEAERLKNVELKIFGSVDVILTPSGEEEKAIRDHAAFREVYTIPAYFYDFLEESKLKATRFSQRYGMVFLGHFYHTPNIDAVKWFLQDILPRVHASKHDLTFDIVGSGPSKEVWGITNNNIHVLGYVKDLAPVFNRTRVSIVPLRYGAGVKGKIVTSLLHGVPVVTTAIGNEGLGLIHGKEALIADDAESFARCIIELHNNQALWEQIAAGGYEYLKRNFSYTRARQIILGILGMEAVFDGPTAKK